MCGLIPYSQVMLWIAIRKATRPLFVDWVTFNNIGWVLRVFKKCYVKMVDL